MKTRFAMTKYGTIFVLTLAVVVLLCGFASAQDKFALNLQAYKGIALADFFGSAAGGSQGLTLAALVDKLSGNLQQYNPASPADAALVKSVLTQIKQLGAQLKGNKGANIGSWPLIAFYEQDMQVPTPGGDPATQSALASLFQNFFLPLDQAGLTLPWLYVAQRNANTLFIDFVYSPQFLPLLGGMTFADFFTLTVDDVDDETANLAQQAVQIGVLGALPAYHAAPSVSVNTTSPGAMTALGIGISSQCCDRTTRVCDQISVPTSYCSICGNGQCCLGASWCPNN